MPLKVIGAGFGRTGTNSLKVALERLGCGPCHHMKEVGASIEQINWFDQVSKGEIVDWNQVFAKFDSAVDWPAAAYYQELAALFPESKVILSVRDPDAWYDSVHETIYAVGSSVPRWLRWFVPPVDRLVSMVMRIIWDGIFAGRFEDRSFAINIFNQHIEEVRKNIPADRLLIHSAKEGWEPICEFLQLPIPNTPYPRVNEAKDIKRMVILLKFLGWLPWILLVIYFFLAVD
jgi:hypothetical protein